MSEWSVLKVFVIGLQKDPNMGMVISEDGLGALFRMWEAVELEMHRPRKRKRYKTVGSTPF